VTYQVAEQQRPNVVHALQQAFLKGYRDATKGRPFLPQDERSFKALLEVMVLEKALYEVRYEVQSRPDWVKIPLGYLRELAGATS
jgi:predicted trehalose synthase